MCSDVDGGNLIGCQEHVCTISVSGSGTMSCNSLHRILSGIHVECCTHLLCKYWHFIGGWSVIVNLLLQEFWNRLNNCAGQMYLSCQLIFYAWLCPNALQCLHWVTVQETVQHTSVSYDVHSSRQMLERYMVHRLYSCYSVCCHFPGSMLLRDMVGWWETTYFGTLYPGLLVTIFNLDIVNKDLILIIKVAILPTCESVWTNITHPLFSSVLSFLPLLSSFREQQLVSITVRNFCSKVLPNI